MGSFGGIDSSTLVPDPVVCDTSLVVLVIYAIILYRYLDTIPFLEVHLFSRWGFGWLTTVHWRLRSACKIDGSSFHGKELLLFIPITLEILLICGSKMVEVLREIILSQRVLLLSSIVEFDPPGVTWTKWTLGVSFRMIGFSILVHTLNHDFSRDLTKF